MVGAKLKYWRAEKRFISIRKLSMATGVTEGTIRGIETGVRTARHDTLVKLCQGLEITLDQLADTQLPEGFTSRVA